MTSRTSARSRLLATADRLFYAEGVHAVGIDRLIKEAGVAKGSLFHNFTGKDELIAAYLQGRAVQRRERIAEHQEGLDDPVDKVLAVFDALAEAAGSPTYNGCPFANATAEARGDGVEAREMRHFRDWLNGEFRRLSEQADLTEPQRVADRLQVLYDGAVSTSHLDGRPEAVSTAKALAIDVLARARR